MHNVIAGVVLGTTVLMFKAGALASQEPVPPGEWHAYGRDVGGARFSPLRRITKENVSRLVVAWTYNTGEAGVTVRRGRAPSLETTPLVVGGTMYISTPLGRVIALDAATGREVWRHDPV
ncbi:MAG TPA: PQQ-binding-like beta-propeller repeat protein, partial [Gemmatimonadaceae bacterium]|nr:PQQ-binding-like beta-propeller repeat protein [Gemmatimonadaceae bacterium]